MEFVGGKMSVNGVELYVIWLANVSYNTVAAQQSHNKGLVFAWVTSTCYDIADSEDANIV